MELEINNIFKFKKESNLKLLININNNIYNKTNYSFNQYLIY